MEPNRMSAGCFGMLFPADKMYVFVEGIIASAGMSESMKALPYMREMHRGQTRSDGQRYEVHPLVMACWALIQRSVLANPNLIDDATIAAILVHDVPEELEMPVRSMPFIDEVLEAVDYMTVPGIMPGETKFEWKKRYAEGLLGSRRSVFGKGLDIMFNLWTMTSTFPEDRVRKNIVETDMIRMPVLRAADEKYSEMAPLMQIIRLGITVQLHGLAEQFDVKLTDPDYKNSPMAKDYSYLIM